MFVYLFIYYSVYLFLCVCLFVYFVCLFHLFVCCLFICLCWKVMGGGEGDMCVAEVLGILLKSQISKKCSRYLGKCSRYLGKCSRYLEKCSRPKVFSRKVLSLSRKVFSLSRKVFSLFGKVFSAAAARKCSRYAISESVVAIS